MRGHAERQRLPSGRNAAKSVASRRRAVGPDHRELFVAVGGGAAMAGNMLEDRQDAASSRPAAIAAGDGGDLFRRRAIGAIPDNRIDPGDRHVGNRRAIDIDAQGARSAAIKVARLIWRRQGRFPIAVVERAIGGARRVARPMRRAQSLHPAAFLIDQDRRPAADAAAKFVNQAPQAIRSATLRSKTISPHGSASLRNCRSSALSAGPATPVIKARIRA